MENVPFPLAVNYWLPRGNSFKDIYSRRKDTRFSSIFQAHFDKVTQIAQCRVTINNKLSGAP